MGIRHTLRRNRRSIHRSVTAVAQDPATITATVDGVPGSTIVTVNP